MEDLTTYGPHQACARAYILKRAEKPTLMTVRGVSAELGMGPFAVRAAILSLIKEDRLRRRRQTEERNDRKVQRSVYEARPLWGWAE